jgi:hypothetical protein
MVLPKVQVETGNSASLPGRFRLSTQSSLVGRGLFSGFRKLAISIALAGMLGSAGCGSRTGVEPTVQHSVSLSWDPSPSQVMGYFVYRGTAPDTLSKLNASVDPSTSYVDNSVTGGQTYFYAVTAVDSSKIESASSNQVTVTVPNN